MNKVYVALETEGQSILYIIGVYSDEKLARGVCERAFVERGFDLAEDSLMFENDYLIKEMEIDTKTNFEVNGYDAVN